MSSREGRRIVARGSIRVDARRARAKLRQHLLVDLHAYTLELARAASALGATRLDVRWDADDVVVGFDSKPIAREQLVRLLDFALVEGSGGDHGALRTLALGVNAALGLGAREVAVVSNDPTGAWRVKFASELLDDDETKQGPETRAEDVPRPANAFAHGVEVQVHRAFGFEVLKRALAGGVPREVALLVEATHGSKLELRVNGEVARRAPRPTALLRARLELPEARSAAVELLQAGTSASFELFERGVRLLENVWTPWPSATQVPLRLVVDADELPTNASRSALRQDSPLALALGSAASEGVRRVLAALSARVLGTGEAPDSVELLESDETQLENALGALCCAAARIARAGEPIDELSKGLLSLPLVHGVAGRRITLGSLLPARAVYVWRSAEPLPEELAPWLGGVVWLRGREVERALDGVQRVDAGELLKLARIGAARRKELLARPATEPNVPKSNAELARRRFTFDASPFAGLCGEVVLLAPIGDKPRPSLLRLFVEQRLIEAIAVEPSTCPLGIDVALSWPEQIRPRFDYAGVERGPELPLAVYAVTMLAIGMADAGASELAALPARERAALASVLRGAINAYGLVPQRLGYGVREPGSFEREYPRLSAARVLPTPNPARSVSVADLSGHARRTGVLQVARSWQTAAGGEAPDGRPVLCAANEEIEAVRTVLGVAASVVSYEPAQRGRLLDTPAERRAALTAAVVDERVRQTARATAPMLHDEQPDFVAVVAPGFEARVLEAHRGVVLRSSARETRSLPLIIAYDDRRTVPTSDWDGLAWAPSRWNAGLEARFVGTLVAALEGDTKAQEALGPGFDPVPDAALAALLIEQATQLEKHVALLSPTPARDQLAELLRRIEALPLLSWADPDGASKPTSLGAAREKHPDQVPLLASAPGFVTSDWWPLVAEAECVRQALRRRSAKVVDASRELEQRRAMAALIEHRQALLARPRANVSDLSGLVADGDRVTTLHGGSDLAVSVALPKPDLDFASPWVIVHFQGRPVCGLDWNELPAPVAGSVDSSSDDDFEAWAKPSAIGRERIRARLLEAATALARDLVEDAQGAGASSKLLGDHRALNLCHALMRAGTGALLEARLMSNDFLWPTVQGGEARLTDLMRTDTKLWLGHERYPRWIRHPSRETDLDRPILYAPLDSTANALAAVLTGLGFQFFDATAALARLHAERHGGAPAAPRLGGIPTHAALRADLADLGFSLGDGELELVDGPTSKISLFLLDGTRRELELELGCPLSAALRVDALDSASVVSELGPALEAAAGTLLGRALPRLGALPSFLRRTARALVLADLVASRDVEAERVSAPVFEDTAGHWHALGDLVRDRHAAYTTLAPPFPVLPAPYLVLTAAEAQALGSGVELTLADDLVERARAAELRRAAPPLPQIELAPAERTASLVTAPFGTATASGEVGVLVPRQIDRRGVRLHVGRRPLGTLDAGPGWPIVACVNDDSIATDAWFERPADEAAARALCDAVRRTAELALKRTFAPPATALAARWLDEVSAGELRVTGTLWLPGSLPEAPRVRVHTADQGVPYVRALAVPSSRAPISPVLPLEGDLLVRRVIEAKSGASLIDPALESEWLWDALGKLAAQVALELVGDAGRGGLAVPVLEEHAWNLALLGLEVTPPPARTSDGKSVGPAEVLAELDRNGAIWLSDGRGWVEGAFPGKTPGFVLCESESRLVHVLELRAVRGVVRRLGGVASEVATGRSTGEPRSPGPDVEETAGADPELWAGVREKLSGLWGGSEVAEAPHPVLAALERLLASLSLTGDPIKSVVATKGRRAFRYDAATGRVLISQRHPAVAALLGRAANDPRAVAVLAAAVLSEVNRALTEVTDAEERRALAALLAEI